MLKAKKELPEKKKFVTDYNGKEKERRAIRESRGMKEEWKQEEKTRKNRGDKQREEKGR